MLQTITLENLKQIELENGETLPDEIALRAHRAISWLERAEQQVDDDDVAFILYWVSFNALYVQEKTDWSQKSERMAFANFFDEISTLDTEDTIYDAFWDRFSSSVRTLMDNKYVYQPFWNNVNQIPGYENWEERFIKSKDNVHVALRLKDTKMLLTTIFDRLYVLRNQLVHGAATWRGKINRPQVKDGAQILAFLVPLFVVLMINNPNSPWGKPTYPVIDAR